jgi:hypothetical protein
MVVLVLLCSTLVSPTCTKATAVNIFQIPQEGAVCSPFAQAAALAPLQHLNAGEYLRVECPRRP